MLKANGIISLNITKLTKSANGDDIDGCEGFWLSDGVNTALNPKDNPLWYQNSCFIYDNSAGKVLGLHDINFKGGSDRLMKGYTWICNAKGIYWQFDPTTCGWVNLKDSSELTPGASIVYFLQTESKEEGIKV